MSPDNLDCGLYVHVPFCSAICPYCDFSVLTGDEARRSRYVDHLLRELQTIADEDYGPFTTVYPRRRHAVALDGGAARSNPGRCRQTATTAGGSWKPTRRT